MMQKKSGSQFGVAGGQDQPQDKYIAAIGITNQRETTIVWDRETGLPVYNAVFGRTGEPPITATA
jgi:glycerol kinase